MIADRHDLDIRIRPQLPEQFLDAGEIRRDVHPLRQDELVALVDGIESGLADALGEDVDEAR